MSLLNHENEIFRPIWNDSEQVKQFLIGNPVSFIKSYKIHLVTICNNTMLITNCIIIFFPFIKFVNENVCLSCNLKIKILC